MPLVNLGLRQGIQEKNHGGWASTAEVSTLQLEFKYLSHLTGNQRYWDVVEKVMEVLRAAQTNTGLVSIFIRWVYPFLPLVDPRYLVEPVFRVLVLLTESSEYLTFGWDLGETLITSTYCEAPCPARSAI